MIRAGCPLTTPYVQLRGEEDLDSSAKEITVWSFKEGQTSDHHNYDLSGSEELVALRGVFLFSIYCRDRPKYPTCTR